MFLKAAFTTLILFHHDITALPSPEGSIEQTNFTAMITNVTAPLNGPTDPFRLTLGNYELQFLHYKAPYTNVPLLEAFVENCADTVERWKTTLGATDDTPLPQREFYNQNTHESIVYRLMAQPSETSRITFGELSRAVVALQGFIYAWSDSRFVPAANMAYFKRQDGAPRLIATGSLGRGRRTEVQLGNETELTS